MVQAEQVTLIARRGAKVALRACAHQDCLRRRGLTRHTADLLEYHLIGGDRGGLGEGGEVHHAALYIQYCDTVVLMERFFEWDDQKADLNFRKHGIRFVDAARVFGDPLAVTVQDRVENSEQRWQTVGMVGGYLLLLVAHTVRFEGEGIEVVRIISARRVDRAERRRYEHR